MSSDHVHDWYVIDRREIPDDPEVVFKVERCRWCGERREYRDTGHYDHF